MGGMIGICQPNYQKLITWILTLFPKLKVEGVPQMLKGNTYSVKFNDFDTIKKIIKKDKDISSIIMEVERDKKPKSDYLKSVRIFVIKITFV